MPSDFYEPRATMLRRASVAEIDATGSQHLAKLRGLKGEELDKVPRIKEFGFSSRPPAGAEAMILALGGRSDRAMVLGIDHKDHGPRDLGVGHTAIYDGHGNMVSLVQKEIRIVGAASVTIKSPVIILDGLVRLGGADADKPAAMLGTIDTDGDSAIGNLATRVLVK